MNTHSMIGCLLLTCAFFFVGATYAGGFWEDCPGPACPANKEREERAWRLEQQRQEEQLRQQQLELERNRQELRIRERQGQDERRLKLELQRMQRELEHRQEELERLNNSADDVQRK